MAARISPSPLFIDTGGFYARFDTDAAEHERAQQVFSKIQSGEIPFRPLFTSTYVLSELATLIISRSKSHTTAINALSSVRNSEHITVIHVGEDEFNATCDQFGQYDDHVISFVDHSNAVLATDREIEYIFTFDEVDHRTLGLTPVPADIGL